MRRSSLKNNTSPGLVIHSLAELGKSLPLSLCLVSCGITNAKIFGCGSLGWNLGGRGVHWLTLHLNYIILHIICEKYREREDDCKTATDTIPALERKNNTLRLLLFVHMSSRVRLCNLMDCTARQTPLSMGFPRQEYWSGLLFHSPGDLPDPGFEPK